MAKHRGDILKKNEWLPKECEEYLSDILQKEPHNTLITSDRMSPVWKTLLSQHSNFRQVPEKTRNILLENKVRYFLNVIEQADGMNYTLNQLTKTQKLKKIEQVDNYVKKLLILVGDLDLDFNSVEEMPSSILRNLDIFRESIAKSVEEKAFEGEVMAYNSEYLNTTLSIDYYKFSNQLRHLLNLTETLRNQKTVLSSPNSKDSQVLYFTRYLTKYFCQSFGQPYYNYTAIITSIYLGHNLIKEDIRDKVKSHVQEWKNLNKK